MCVVVYMIACRRQPLLFFLFYLVPLKFTLTILNFRVVLSFIDISTLIHNLLFIIFVLRSFVKFWFVFNNNLESIIVIWFFILIWSSFFWFWLFILNPYEFDFYFWFSPSIQDSNLSSLLFFYFKFGHHSLNCYFFYFRFFCIIDFFLISLFNI